MRCKEDRHEDDVRILLRHLRVRPDAAVVHVGAHHGEEVEAYLEAGFSRVVLIEANPEAYAVLRRRFDGDQRVRPFHCALSSRNGAVDLHVHTSRSGSAEPASILPLKRFKEIVPTLRTVESVRVPGLTLDSFLAQHGMAAEAFDLLNVDVQGAELLVLEGAARALRSIGAVICEVSLIELYEGSALEDQIVEFLGRHGFAKVDGIYHTLYERDAVFPAWGECLFLRGPS